ncbi:glycosyltransferase [Confluentibacter citreus]|uniref:glycosyltransferase n=1 Tax=Confluentibacter citreus TaxID=2007307 RepID=UPI000C28AF23|nr:glycosyltransferase [Confluentibacter citreus]
MNKTKIFFIIPTLFAGGAERVMSFVSQNLKKEKFDVTLVVIGFEKDSKYQISGIKVRYLNKTRVLNSIFDIIKLIKKEKPHIVVSALSHLNIAMGYISLLFPKIKFIGRHTIVSKVAEKYKAKNRNKLNLIISHFSSGYKYLDIILCQSKDMYNDIKDNFNVDVQRLRIINNPITDNFNLKTVKNNPNEVVKFVTVARLKKLKGHERIINAISKLNFPYQYIIIGDGPERENIFNKIKTLGIEDKVIHIPYTSEVSKYLSESDYYLMGSYAEGFPNCLIESCSVGTPIIAFKAPGGLDEIIDEGVNGFMSESEEEFVGNIMKSVKNHKWDINEISDSVLKKFNKEKIIIQYENLFMDILK